MTDDMTAATRMSMLRADLQRTSGGGVSDEYLTFMLQAASGRLERQGIRDDGSGDYAQVLVSTAAWLYRKRVSGGPEPDFLRQMRRDLIVSQRVRGKRSDP